jgi:hypothetical protein
MNQGYTKGFKGSVAFAFSLRPTIEEPGRFTGRLVFRGLQFRIEGRIVLNPIVIVALTEATKAIAHVSAVFN